MSSNETILTEQQIINVLDKKEPHPLDEATYRYKTSVARITVLNGTLSKKALARVYNAMIGFPLSDKVPKLKGLENELFMLTLTALSAKDYILEFVMANQTEIMKNIPQEENKGEVNVE